MIKTVKNAIPNTITLLNLLAGVVAVIFAFSPRLSFGDLRGWQWSSIMIGAAALFDFLDGASARILKAYSTLGKELDSLADMVSFGVAPALLLMNTLLEADGGNASYFALFLVPMGALRLAKFNIDTEQTTTFKGLPIPANAIFWIGVVAAMYNNTFRPSISFMIFLIFAIGILMVCNMKMFSLKFSNFKFAENLPRIIIILAAVVLVAIFGISGMALTIMLYILMSLLKNIIKISYK